MLEYEWYLTLLKPDDLVAVCKIHKIPVEGFKRPDNAPANRVHAAIKNTLRSGFNGGKNKRGKKPLTYESLLEGVAKEYMNKNILWNDINFELFLEKSEIYYGNKPFVSVALLYSLFPDIYKEQLHKMLENSKLDKFIFYGFQGYKESSTYEKINNFVSTHLLYNKYPNLKSTLEDFSYSLNDNESKTLEEFILLTQQIDDLSLYKLLMETHKDVQYLLLLAFLYHNDNYSNSDYKIMSDGVELILSEKRQNLLCNNLTLTSEIAKELPELKSANSQLVIQNNNLRLNLEKALNDKKDTQEKFELLTGKIDSFNLYLKFFESFSEKIKDEFIVAGGDSFDLGPYLKNNSMTIKALKDIKKQGKEELLRNKTIFLTRNAFFHSHEWSNMKNFLDKNDLEYEELYGFSELEYLEQIIKWTFERETKLYDYNF
ncbi:hypothetical protein [Peribacillus frigoritolerans]|uniref:hypothetical protein n=1 Tax=Peribacillus frigoritolerans TaxID=450367 RepID=UPI001059B50D|nr:hypothetical protein [Peribacillus frigoritolerans]TDL82096.1 hypothetical protein E2R53_00460 [Peribacillus frigoritolerans]